MRRARAISRATPRATLAATLAIAGLLAAVAPGSADAGAPLDEAAVGYLLPHPGAVVRAFDEVTGPYAPGHRGVDFAVTIGDPVIAAAPGTVSFAGPVAEAAWVSIEHPDGIVTSYGPLLQVRVRKGDALAAGDEIGTVAGGHGPGGSTLHWGARRDGTYIDPLSLVVLRVPTLVGRGSVHAHGEPEVPGSQWRRCRSGLTGALPMPVAIPMPTHSQRVDAGEDGWELPPNPNHVIGLAGHSSYHAPDSAKGEKIPMDLRQLGYTPEDTTYFSYAGRHDEPWDDPADPRRDQLPYEAEDTWEGVEAAATKLREQLRAQWRRSPGQAVDLVGHSMGGLVAAYYLLELHDPTDPTLPPIGNVMLIAAPLDGSDLATAALTASLNPHRRAQFLRISALFGAPQPDPRVRQSPHDFLSGSEVVEAVQTGWIEALEDLYGGPLGTGTRVLTVGAELDVVVPERRTALPGGEHVLLPGGHSGVRNTEASRVTARAFLTGDPVPCGSGGMWHYASYGLGVLQRLIGTGLALSVP